MIINKIRKENNMDAGKFVREFRRICNKHNRCASCILNKTLLCDSKRELSHEESERIVEIVEDWSRENPECVGKKYIIEISRMTPTGRFQVKGTHATFTKAELDFFEEYKEHDACKGCKYEDKTEKEEPCVRCRYAYRDKWEATR
jgi:hypothetical protein